MEIGTIIFLENVELEKAVSEIGRLSTKKTSIEYFIGETILIDTFQEYSPQIKSIFDKYRILIIQGNTNELALQKLVENWDDYFENNVDFCKSLKQDFENMEKLIQNKYSVLEVFIAIYNGSVLKRQTNYQYWKFKKM